MWHFNFSLAEQQAATDDADEMHAKAERAAREHENSKRSDYCVLDKKKHST